MPIGEIAAVVKKHVGTRVYYFGTVTSDKLKGITSVPVIEASPKTFLNERTEDGYQRPGSQVRMRQFAKYLKDNPNSVVPPILMSSRDAWQFQPTPGETVYGKLIVNAAAYIIDGQHRAGGYVSLFEETGDVRPVDFVLLEGLTKDEERDEFTTVNSTQKGVPKPLFAFLEGEAPAMLGWALNEENDSPFKGRITRVKMAKQ
ncbi:MAG: DGQHR domain-containing protein, partial [Verrucomicrobiales bacterium]|nr:DGQHR domain-containing protein [Verrucomicrobiales bacterium]